MNGLNRRQFLAATAASGLMLGAGPVWAQTAEPKRGGTMRIGHLGGATSDSIDPATYAAGPVVTAMLAVCNNLVEIDAEGNPQPELAESWEPSADAKSWTFRLRGDARFSDGRACTPADVIASFNHHRGENSTSGAKGSLAQVVDIKADGENAVIFELESGNADFAMLLTDYHFVIMPARADGTLDWESGLGTGGYVLTSHEPGVLITLTRRDDYWKQGRAWFDTVELRTINDATARQNALITGEVDVINGPDLSTLHLLQRQPGLHLVEVPGTAHYTMPMFTDVAPFDNVDVRLAMKYAVNRQEIVEKILYGHGAVANDSPIAPANRFYAGDLEQRAYDPERSKFHLKKAGLDRLAIDLSAADAAFSGAINMATLFQQSAAVGGIDINILREADDGYWSNVWLKKPFCLSYWNGRPTEDDMFGLVYAKGAEWNESHWANDRFNELLLKARAELNNDLRREMYREMQQLVSDDGGTIIPCFVNYIDVRNEKVAHGPVASNRFFDGWKIVERWWSAV